MHGERQHGGAFFRCHAAEKPHFDKLGLQRIRARKPLQGIVNREQGLIRLSADVRNTRSSCTSARTFRFSVALERAISTRICRINLEAIP